ncbi:MAG: lytic transglycosylase domain-containing protein, partial [bacterium]
VAWCESRFETHAQYGGALGIMQMMPYWFTSAGLDPDQWSDPVTNLRAALFAYQEHERNHADPWGPWTCKPDHGLAGPD